MEANGLIITNNHVVSKADEIRVFLSDKREFKAQADRDRSEDGYGRS